MRILFLATDAHGGFGGISQYNRDVLKVLAEWDRVEKVFVLPRVVEHEFDAPVKLIYADAAARGLLAYLATCLRAALSSKSFDLIYCAHLNLVPFARLVAGLTGKPIVLAIYGIEAWAPPRRRLVAWLAKGLKVPTISISRITADRYMQWSGVDTAQVCIVPNAIHVEEYGLGPRPKYLVDRYGLRGRRVIMTMGRMPDAERQKGFDEVLESMPSLLEQNPDLAYVLVGDGPDRVRLEQKAQGLGLGDAVVFTGRISEIEKADHYRLADAYVMPSSGEGFGFVVLEALACGLPVVASRVDGTYEAVRDGLLGKVVDPADRTGLLNSIKAVLNEPKQVHPGLDFFSFENFGKRIRSIFSQAAGTHA